MSNRGYSQLSARGNFATGDVITGANSYYGTLFYVNSAIANGTSGGHSALLDIIYRPDADMPWVRYGDVITATHGASAAVPITGNAMYWATRTLSAFSANGSAPSVTTFFDFP